MEVGATPPTVPNLPPAARRNVERGLRELRVWRTLARDDYRNATDPTERQRLRQLADDLEWLTYRLEQLLHPMTNPTATPRGNIPG